MKKNIFFYIFILLLNGLTVTDLIAQNSSVNRPNQLHLYILDAANQQPVSDVYVSNTIEKKTYVCDNNGYLTIETYSANIVLTFSHIAFKKATLSLHIKSDTVVTCYMVRTVEVMNEVWVTSSKIGLTDMQANTENVNGVEHLVAQIKGIHLLQRANFANEAIIRGFQGGQIGVTIDGMKLYGACIDKMDPASSYVEMENLEAIEVSTGGSDLSKASQIGGHINFVTSKPKLSDQPSLNIQTENGFESNALLRRTRNSIDYASTNWGFRGSYSYRGASDFSDGSGKTITRSGFEKRNYKAAISAKWNNHVLTASFLGDDAWNVGFPVLLMDATLAQSRLYSLEHLYTSSKQNVTLSQRFYGNTVDHWMDDRHRDVAKRRVMNNMFMPMFGNTRTMGYLAGFSKEVNKHQFSATLDLHRTSMFGDMYMYSLFPDIPDMYLINVGDAVAFNSAITGSWKTILSSKITSGISIRFDYSNRDVQNPTMQQLFQRTWNLNSTQNTYILPNSSVFVEYRNHNNHVLKLEFSANQRLPTTVENYGHYVYNYVDGFFYAGNPSLLPEQAFQTGLRYSILETKWQLDISGFYSELRNIITGIQADDSNLGAISGGSYQFRVYSNAQSGFKFGGETAFSAQLSPVWLFRTSLSYVYGQNRSFNEPLPMLPPLTGVVLLRFTKGNYLAEIDSKWTLAQNRIARFAAIEDATDGWNVVNFRTQANLKNRFVIKAGIENVFNRFFIDHLSFGNLPSQGRNVYLSLSYSFSSLH